jgi:hypothetical protein
LRVIVTSVEQCGYGWSAFRLPISVYSRLRGIVKSRAVLLAPSMIWSFEAAFDETEISYQAALRVALDEERLNVIRAGGKGDSRWPRPRIAAELEDCLLATAMGHVQPEGAHRSGSEYGGTHQTDISGAQEEIHLWVSQCTSRAVYEVTSTPRSGLRWREAVSD